MQNEDVKALQQEHVLSFRPACEKDCGRLAWWCLDWNQPAIDFYKSMGAKAMEEWTVYRIDGDTLMELGKQ